MSFDPLDLNRYASGAEAASAAARVHIERADVDIATKRREHARDSLKTAAQRFLVAEVVYKMCGTARDHAVEYDRQAAQLLDESVGRLALAKAPLHPVRKAPLEVLGMIFEWCIDLSPLSPSGSPLDKRRDVRIRQCRPFQLAAVCRRWRQASHSYARMWRTLDLRLDDIALDNAHLWLRYITAVIARSAAVPMHIHVFRARPFVELVDVQLVNALVPLMSRCKHLVLCARIVQDPEDSLSVLLLCATPLLRSLYLRVGHITQNQFRLLPDAPNLCYIDAAAPITKVTSTFPGAKMALLAASVTTSDMRRDDIARIQGACPKLDDLTLLDPTIAEVVRVNRFVLNMSILRIKYSKPAANGDLLAFSNQFSLPRICFLVIYGDLEGSTARVAFLATVLPQWRTLSRLTIGTISNRDFEAFCNALIDATNLEELVLEKVYFETRALRRFCEALGLPSVVTGAWICPPLCNLDLYDCTLSPGCIKEDIFELVARRLRAADSSHDEQRPARLLELYLPQEVEDSLSNRIGDLFELY